MNDYILNFISRVAIHHRLIRHMTHLSLRIKVILHNRQIHEHIQAVMNHQSASQRSRHHFLASLHFWCTILWRLSKYFRVDSVPRLFYRFVFLFHMRIAGKWLIITEAGSFEFFFCSKINYIHNQMLHSNQSRWKEFRFAFLSFWFGLMVSVTSKRYDNLSETHYQQNSSILSVKVWMLANDTTCVCLCWCSTRDTINAKFKV